MTRGNLLEKAANYSDEGITISSMSALDRPLIYVNEGFEKLTGYQIEEVLGRNCRFLQGPGTDENAVEQIRQAINRGEKCTVEILNYKKDGTPFWNRLSITPIKDNTNRVTHYVGIQSDITELKENRKRLELANKELSKFRQDILKELEQARVAQQFILPQQLPISPKVGFASMFIPMEQIGGDFFDIITLDKGIYGLLIADVTGHGIPAALLTFMSSTTFKNTAAGVFSTASAIESTNRKLFQKMPDDAFVTMFYAIYNSDTYELKYTQAGHPEAYILRPETNEIISLKTGGTLLGAFSGDEVSFSEKSIILHPGDKLILYTDAIIDALLVESPEPQEDRFKSFLLRNCQLPLQTLFPRIYQYGLEISGSKSYQDDFTLIGMEVTKSTS